ncbi:MAG TPA: DUF192 domain-containing protein [Phycisphaerales bacterium]|nr:DUF192 domain-containing protein [Phycisphaerales bacterium]
MKAIQIPLCVLIAPAISIGAMFSCAAGFSALLTAGSQGAGSRPSASQPADSQPAASQPEVPHVTLRLKGIDYSLELATDDKAREIGLMNRDHLETHTGMLFIYPREHVLNFWMKNCAMDIDVIFLDAHGIITAMHEMKREPLQEPGEPLMAYETRLKTYSSKGPAVFAIEVAAGETKKLGFKVGESIEFDRAGLRKLAK